MEIPVVDCPHCKETVPVAIEAIPVEVLGKEFDAIYCAICDNVLNVDGDVEVTYFDEEELPKAIGWRVVESEGNDGRA